MGKKAKLKAIKRLASSLPWINQSSTELHHLKGSEILEWGTIKEIEGKPIDPGKMYQVHMPVLMIQNNARATKRAYLRNGVAGISHFLNSTHKTVEQHFKNMQHGR